MNNRPLISIFAAIGQNREIGKKGNLIWSLKDDMRYFVENTKGKVVIMGRKTFTDCIGHALEGRINIVVTRKPGSDEDGVYYVKSVKQALEAAKAFCVLNDISEICFIGGESIYRHAIRHADVMYITHINALDPEADSFFPVIDNVIWKPFFKENFYDESQEILFDIVGYRLAD